MTRPGAGFGPGLAMLALASVFASPAGAAGRAAVVNGANAGAVGGRPLARVVAALRSLAAKRGIEVEHVYDY